MNPLIQKLLIVAIQELTKYSIGKLVKLSTLLKGDIRYSSLSHGEKILLGKNFRKVVESEENKDRFQSITKNNNVYYINCNIAESN